MGFSCGIVGLPNVGKSTLFNAITRTSNALAANYPFCTIEPNSGLVEVTDSRLDKLAEIAGSQKIIYNQLKVTDIAGLVKGASQGEGLGNQFLGHIRESKVILHVLRCFEDKDIKHVSDRVNPIEDAELIEMELALADIQSLQKRIAKSKHKQEKDEIDKIITALESGKTLINEDFDPESINALNLLSTKPMIYVCNVEESSAKSGNELSAVVSKMAQQKGRESIIISAQIEEEISKIEDREEREMFLQELGLGQSGLERIAKCGYDTLGLITFFTVGPKEARAWPLLEGTPAPGAAGVIHSDFEKGFIKAEIISTHDYLDLGGEAACRKNGKLRIEGRDYIIQDGDIANFRFN